jgi:hypothetical protein
MTIGRSQMTQQIEGKLRGAKKQKKKKLKVKKPNKKNSTTFTV